MEDKSCRMNRCVITRTIKRQEKYKNIGDGTDDDDDNDEKDVV